MIIWSDGRGEIWGDFRDGNENEGFGKCCFPRIIFLLSYFLGGGGGVEKNGKEWGKWRELGKMGGGERGV